MNRLTLSLTPLFCKTDVRQNFQTIWCSDLQEAKYLLEKVYMLDGWNIEQPIEVKWNWKRFDYLYSFRVSKHLGHSSSQKKLPAITLFR